MRYIILITNFRKTCISNEIYKQIPFNRLGFIQIENAQIKSNCIVFNYNKTISIYLSKS